jgi:long-chain fatty acid transport protein
MKFSRLKMLACLSITAAFSLSFTEAHAFLAGAKATGMAATGIAYPQDSYAGAYNPAGTVDVQDRIDGTFEWIQDRGHSLVEGNLAPVPGVNGKYNAFRTKDTYCGDFGFNKTFCSNFFCEDYRWAVGIVMFNRDYQKTTYSRDFVLLGTSHLGLEYLHETIAPYAALAINECHSIGVSVDVHVQRAMVNGIQNFDNALFSAFPGKVTNKGYAYSAGVGATIGWKWNAWENLTVGVTYRTKANMSKFHKYKGFLAQKGRLDVPQKWGVGLAYKFFDCATLAFDFEWVDWHQIHSLSNKLLNGPDVPAPPPINQLGSNNGPGFGFRNQLYYRVGLDYQFNDSWTVRVGYRHANSPIRRTQTAVNLLTCDAVEDFVTVGLTYNWNCCLEVSAFYAYGFSHRVKGKNAIPAFLGGGNINLTEAKDALGVQVGYIF